MPDKDVANLAIDEEVDRALADPESPIVDLEALIAADEVRALWGLARALRRAHHDLEILSRDRVAILGEYDRRMAAFTGRAERVNGYIEEIVKARRARGEGNTVSLPGVGEWSTREVPAGWEIKTTATAERDFIAFLREHYEAEAKTIIEDKPRLDRVAMRAWLDSLDDEAVVPLLEGLRRHIERRAERISVSFRTYES